MPSEERSKKVKATGEWPRCADICPTQRNIKQLQESCASCELRTKKYDQIKKPTMEDFFGGGRQ